MLLLEIFLATIFFLVATRKCRMDAENFFKKDIRGMVWKWVSFEYPAIYWKNIRLKVFVLSEKMKEVVDKEGHQLGSDRKTSKIA